MEKVIGKIFLIVFLQMLVLGISGCGGEKHSSSISQTQLDSSRNPSTISSKSLNTTKSSSYQKAQAVPVLYYHSVMLEEGNEVRMPPDQFAAQMAYLQEKGYESVTLDQLYQALYKGGVLPQKPIVITFDDGYEDNYATAFPIVKKYGFTAAVFMVSSYIGGEGFMSWSQLRELSANGWEIEGHTVNHPYLSQVDKTTVLNELMNSKETLEEGLGKSVGFFAYPYGDFNADVAQAVKQTGYLMAFTTDRGWADLNLDEWHLQRVYCFANMGLNEFARRLQEPNY
ncbi:polysaccharide deacetylase family protein [Desulfosporosinus shakirovi]|uniref:polysaccharide deacetylase family protein n=1 Tax=Desulfosporosinus shakirovi TaxID=2885154 RepID=UPI001E56CB53|nr:polysaccharide deacetylase family protein [Desulfosporosinus sp. SRJS8]MCB8818246.1 polysaccharide deacetylase family protein [Desulfosporosinus sp. SRJS8]